jgi:hypothetical protein
MQPLLCQKQYFQGYAASKLNEIKQLQQLLNHLTMTKQKSHIRAAQLTNLRLQMGHNRSDNYHSLTIGKPGLLPTELERSKVPMKERVWEGTGLVKCWKLSNQQLSQRQFMPDLCSLGLHVHLLIRVYTLHRIGAEPTRIIW